MTSGDDLFAPSDRSRSGLFAPGNRVGLKGGRRSGSRNKRTIAMENLMAGEIEGIARAVINAALAGDMAAAKLVLDRIAPRPRGRPVAWEDAPDIDISTPAGRAGMLSAIVMASINGEISPEDAQSLGAGLEIIRRNEEQEKLIADVEAIKERLGIENG